LKCPWKLLWRRASRRIRRIWKRYGGFRGFLSRRAIPCFTGLVKSTPLKSGCLSSRSAHRCLWRRSRSPARIRVRSFVPPRFLEKEISLCPLHYAGDNWFSGGKPRNLRFKRSFHQQTPHPSLFSVIRVGLFVRTR
jgi:hypothetical protein